MAELENEAERDLNPRASGDGAGGGDFPIVGIGASAGGLKAAEAFLEAMPVNSGMAFVLVQHLDPDHDSMLADLLQNHTSMKVTQLAEDTQVRPDHVYVIPPNRSLAIRDGMLALAELNQPRGRPAVIDQFLSSLADDRRELAIGIVLSGSGTEGAKGLAAIKEHGGITMAQDEAEAEYSSMPSNAIASGCVDLVLPVAQMPAKLLELSGHAQSIDLQGGSAPLEQDEVATLNGIFAQVRANSGHDFSAYKRGMMLRRIGRRMRLRGRTSLDDYLGYLRENEAEVETLFGEFLISVTGFFRDPEATQALARTVIPKLFEGRNEDETIRIWVPGCATGEEAYSLAILLTEAGANLKRPPRVQIFATDIDEAALTAARIGIYRENIAQDVSAERLDRFFSREAGGYRVGKTLREMILFSRHNLLQDPPFAKLDLISCRNVLIYLTEEIQAKVFAFFHFALKPGGYLYLGSSESLFQAVEQFSDVDRKARLFRRREGAAAVRSFPTPVPGASHSPGTRSPNGTGDRRRNGELPQRFLLERFAPPCVIVDENWCITYVSGRVGNYLELAVGKPTQDILELAREGLGLELRLALAQAARSGAPVTRDARVAVDGGTRTVRLAVEPIPESDGMLMVAFDDEQTSEQERSPATVTPDEGAGAGVSARVRDPGGGPEADESLLAEIEAELKNSKALLQATISDLETANEELRAANEELQSMNEELQSTGEELQTSQEELQSTNEELVTVNQELHSKVEELSEANSVLDNLGASTNIATLFLDKNLNVRRYTPRATDLFHLIPADIGRPFEHVAHRFELGHLIADATAVVENEISLEREHQSDSGDWYLVRTLPYNDVEGASDGVVITLVDITSRKQVEEELRAKDARLHFTLDATGVGEWDLDLETLAITRSPRHDQIFGYETMQPEWNFQTLLEHVHEDERASVQESFDRVRSGEDDDPLDVICRTVGNQEEPCWIHIRGQLFHDSAGTPRRILGVIEDVTARVEAERAVRELSAGLERRVLRIAAQLMSANDELDVLSYSVSHDLRAPLRGIDGFSHALLEEHSADLGPSGKGYLERIRAGAQRMGALIDDLLELSRLAHGEMQIREVNLSSAAESSLANLRTRQPERQVDFQVEDDLTVSGDPGLLKLAMERLLENAWKFTATREETRIAVGRGEAGGEPVFYVRDNGVGFDMRHVSRLFGPFQRLHSVEEFPGRGIGLAMVRRIVHRHGGKVWAEAEVGKGATFYFTLPSENGMSGD